MIDHRKLASVEDHLRSKLKTIAPTELSYHDFEVDGLLGPRHMLSHESYDEILQDIHDGTLAFSIAPDAANKISYLTNTGLTTTLTTALFGLGFLWPLIAIGASIWFRDWRYALAAIGFMTMSFASPFNRGRSGCLLMAVLVSLGSALGLELPWAVIVPATFVPFAVTYLGKSLLQHGARLAALKSVVLLQGMLEDGDVILKDEQSGLLCVPSLR